MFYDLVAHLHTYIHSYLISKTFFLVSVASGDKPLIATSVDILYSQDMLTYDEVVNICLASNHTKMKLLDDKLAALQSSSEW